MSRLASASGAAIGALNGALVAYGRLPSFLVTLGTMGVFAGVARRLTDLKSIPIENDTFNALFGSSSLFGVPSLVLWTVAAVAIGYFVFHETRFGAHVHAIGDSANASRASGIKVLRLRFAVMLMSGVLAALAGLLYAGRLNGARYTLGEADLLTVIAAVIVGGTRLNGGVRIHHRRTGRLAPDGHAEQWPHSHGLPALGSDDRARPDHS